MSVTSRTKVKALLKRFPEAEAVLVDYDFELDEYERGLTLEALCREYGHNFWELKADLVDSGILEDDGDVEDDEDDGRALVSGNEWDEDEAPVDDDEDEDEDGGEEDDELGISAEDDEDINLDDELDGDDEDIEEDEELAGAEED